MEIKKRTRVTVVSSPDAPGLVGRTGEAWPTGDGRVEVDGIRDPQIDLALGLPTFTEDQLRKA
jgi:hypothetical protein